MATLTRYWRLDSTTGGDGTANSTSGATRAYESLSALISAEAADLAADGDILHAICTEPGEETPGVLSLASFTTSAASYVLIECQDDAHHGGVSRLKDSAGYQVTRAGDVFGGDTDYWRLKGLELHTTGNSYQAIDDGGDGAASSDRRVDQCLLVASHVDNSTGYIVYTSGAHYSFTNTLMLSPGHRGADFRPVISLTMDHCGLIHGNETTHGRYGWLVDSAATVTNSYSVGSYQEEWYQTVGAGSNNASIDASATPSTGEVTITAGADEFTAYDSDPAFTDATLKDSKLNEAGTGSEGFDITGAARTGTADIGPFNFAVAGNIAELPSAALTITENAPQAVTTAAAANIAELPSTALTLTPNAPQAVSSDSNRAIIRNGQFVTELTITENAPQAVTSEAAGNIAQLPSVTLTVTNNAPQAVVTEANTSVLPSVTLTVTNNAPQAVTTEQNISVLPTVVLTITENVPQAVATEANVSALPSATLTITGNAPSVEATEHHLSQPPDTALTITANAPQTISTQGEVALPPSVVLTVANNAPQAVASEHHYATLPSATLTITENAPQATASEGASGEVATLPAIALTLTPNAPQSITSELHIAVLPSAALSLTENAPSAVASEHHYATLPSADIALTANNPSTFVVDGEVASLASENLSITTAAPQAVTTEKNIAELPATVLTVTPSAPTVNVTDPNTVLLPNTANRIVAPEDFTDAAWTPDGLTTVNSNIDVAPDGRTTMDRLVVSTSNVRHRIFDRPVPALLAGEVADLSIFVKDDGARYVYLNLIASTNDWITAVFDLVSETVTDTAEGLGTGTYIASGITNEGGGIYRLNLQGSCAVADAFFVFGTCDSATPTYDTTGGVSHSPGLGEDIIVWGAQVSPGSLIGYRTFLTLTPNAPATIVSESHIVQLASATLTITANAPNAVASENHIAVLASEDITLTTFAPSVFVPNNELSATDDPDIIDLTDYHEFILIR